MLTEVGREVHEQGKTSTGRQMMEEYSKQITELENTLNSKILERGSTADQMKWKKMISELKNMAVIFTKIRGAKGKSTVRKNKIT